MYKIKSQQKHRRLLKHLMHGQDKIPGELFLNLQGFMRVEFHSKAHGIWWVS